MCIRDRALNRDLVCDAINTAMRELFLQIVYGRSPVSYTHLKENRHRHENLIIAGLLYGVSVAWGVVIEVLGITF